MTRLSFDHQARLAEADRIQQIGELVATAVIRHCRRQRIEQWPGPGKQAASQTEAPQFLLGDETERRIVRFIATAGSAAPLHLCAGLGLPRATVTRKLTRLRTAGVLVVTGRTKGARYRLRHRFEEN